MNRLARLISLVFDPRLVVPVLLLLAVLTAYNNGAKLMFLALLLFIDGVVPGMFYRHLHKSGEISDWDISRRRERLPLYLFTTVVHLGGVGLAWFYGQAALAQVLGIFWVLAVIFTLVTAFWKVSVHVGVSAALVTFLLLTGGVSYWWLYFLVGLVAWSRLVLKRHKIEQVLIGGLLGVLGVLAGFGVR